MPSSTEKPVADRDYNPPPARSPDCRVAAFAIAAMALGAMGLAGVASAVIIDSVDGDANTTGPVADPNWDYTGTRSGLSAVYLGDGWVITAAHVGAGTTTLGGVSYPSVFASTVRLQNGDGSDADLVVFAIDPYPMTPLLPIAASAPAIGAELILAGNGRKRGVVTSWDPNGPPPPGPILGYEWGSGKTLRWGTNHLDDFPPSKVLDTWSFATRFDAAGSHHESQAALGDSGGAVFAFDGVGWVLAGILFATGNYSGQPANTSLYGQLTYAADLSYYRDDILDVIALPEPSGGLPAGIALLLALSRRRTRRDRGQRDICLVSPARKGSCVVASTHSSRAFGPALQHPR